MLSIPTPRAALTPLDFSVCRTTSQHTKNRIQSLAGPPAVFRYLFITPLKQWCLHLTRSFRPLLLIVSSRLASVLVQWDDVVQPVVYLDFCDSGLILPHLCSALCWHCRSLPNPRYITCHSLCNCSISRTTRSVFSFDPAPLDIRCSPESTERQEQDTHRQF